MKKTISNYLLIVLLVALPGCDPRFNTGLTQSESGALYGGHYNRFHNAVRVEHASQNLADAVEAQCGASNPKAAAAASQARAAAQEIDSAIAVFNDTDTTRITNAVAQAQTANQAAYNQYLACGGTPKSTDPRIPGYSETFWDISS